MAQIWEVVGGKKDGGILVRAGRQLASEQLPDRLSTGALIEEVELVGERLSFKRLTGSGPEVGWVSLKAKSTDLVVKTDKRPEEDGAAEEAAAAPGAQVDDSVEVDAELRSQTLAAARAGAAQLENWCMRYKPMKFPLPAEQLRFRVFCFHNAGSTESIYTGPRDNPLFTWAKESKCVEIVAPSYPGRDKLRSQQPHETTDALIGEMLPVLLSKMADGVPYAILSHSVGTWVAFELLMLARKIGLPMPSVAFFNGFTAPQLPTAARPWRVNRSLSDDELKEEVLAWDRDHFGGAGRIVFNEPEWTDTWNPLMRADFRLFDEYEFRHADSPKFKFPIHSLHMEKENFIEAEMQELWEEWTEGEFSCETLPGMGHLTCVYVPDCKKAYMNKVVGVLQSYVP